MQPTSLAVTPTAPRADARDAPAAPALTLAADTRSVRSLRNWASGMEAELSTDKKWTLDRTLSVTALVVAVIALGLHWLGVWETFYNKPYELEIGVLSFGPGFSTGELDEFHLELSYGNTGEQDVLMLRMILMLPWAGTDGHTGMFATDLGSETGDVQLTIKPGERVVRKYAFRHHRADVESMLPLTGEGEEEIDVTLEFTFIGPMGFDPRPRIGGLRLRAKNGRITGGGCRRGVHVFDGRRIMEKQHPSEAT